MNLSLSVIIPVLNQAPFIRQCIDSVLEQQYPRLEIIIIDGGSTDGTVEIIRSYEDKLFYWISEPDLGQTDAINKGMARAGGKIVSWLNADDYYLPGAFSTIINVFENQPDIDICSGAANIVDASGNILRNTYGTVIYSQLAKTIGWLTINQPETFFRKSILDTIGKLNEDLQYNMDKELWLKYLLLYGQKNVAHINQIVVAFRLHPSSKTVAKADYFTIERDILLVSAFRRIGSHPHLQKLEQVLYLPTSPYRFQYKHLVDKQLYNAALQYYILLKSDEYYVAQDYRNAWHCLRLLGSSIIRKEPRLYFSLLINTCLKWKIV